ncbi:anti sigma factor C-terminal domain-containing protein [Clostridium sp. C8-1-8]|uniref:anti sigma factor C-terminal domain-containing protein n=1 Tax=Clostridium sp. C8-1-8 TaxID=2698831 RepID=UPI001371B6E2|nr:anti sigma factor C-terminal domain-containing protein [Clostridium sp. C8-1-8]
MKDNIENKLDELFDKKSKKNRKIIFVAKVKSIAITVSIILVILSLIYVGMSRVVIDKVINKIDIKLFDKKSLIVNDIEKEYEIMHPNQYIAQVTYLKGFLSGNIKIDTCKVIEKNVVADEPIEREFNLKEMLGSENQQYVSANESGNGIATISPGSLHDKLKNVDFFNRLGQRKMIFFYPFSDYKDLYRNDISKLEQVGDKKVAEMALSFDKYYSMEEIQKVIPTGITVTWYWVDDISEEGKKAILASDEKDTKSIREGYNGTRKDGLFRTVVSEENAIGIKAIDMNGCKIDNPQDNFVRSIYRNDYKDENIKALKSKLQIKQTNDQSNVLKYNKQNIRIGGVVVTGSVEQLKGLSKISSIKASTFGVILDKY